MAGIKVTGTGKQIERLQNIAKAANASVMKKTMFFIRNLIVQRTERGEFLNGSGKKYSTAGALYRITSQALKREYLRRMKGTRKKKGESTARFIFLEKGYMQYRQIHGRQVGFVDLNFTGDMMASMNDIQARDKYASLGFRSATEAKKARFLSEMGAGKNKIKYEFFGISEAEKDRALDVFDQAWSAQLKELGVL